MEKKAEIIKFKFEDVVKSKDANALNLLHEYLEFIKHLDIKNKERFSLSKEEIDKIVIKIDNNWKILNCDVESFNSFEIGNRYEILVKLENKKNKEIFKAKKSLMKKNYKFGYKDDLYLCFMMESLQKFFSEIKKENDFYIEISQNEDLNKELNKDLNKDLNKEIISIQPSSFFSMNIDSFNIKLNYKFITIQLKNLETKKIYEPPEIIKGSDLNEKLGSYTDLIKNDYDNFTYYETKERKNILKYLSRLSGINNIIGLCGPFGTGKTVTLLKFLIESPNNRVFYVNLWTISHTYITYIKELFKYESIKLFGGNIFNSNEKFCLLDDREIYKKIINEIDNFVDKKKIFSLLENIIKYLNDIKSQENTYIIIDQYSSKYDEENKQLNHLLNVNKNSNIFIIISSSMNNYDIKRNFSETLNLDLLFSSESFKSNLQFNYYYIGCLIRLNQLDNYKDLLKDEPPEFIKDLNELGNIPLFYYELKNILKWKGRLGYYMEKEKKRIIEEFELFYENPSQSSSLMKFEDILKILSIVNEKEIYFVDELSKKILTLPLKFLEIKKEKRKLSELKIFAFASKNQRILDKIKVIEEDDKVLNKLITYDKYSKSLTQFINEDNFCLKYIEQISENKRKKILGKESDKYINEITIYYLDYLFPYMEEIFSGMIYDILITTSQLIFSYLPPQSQGGFLEYIINIFVKRHEKFMNEIVQNFETIECLVPNSFFIQNYSSRKTETLKTYTEDKNNLSDKKELPKNNIFISQKQFTGKYYDYGLLIYKRENDSFMLYLFQVSKKKISLNRYYKEEHKIIFNRVKENLEEKYSIKIDTGYFSYILVYEDMDKQTIEFCKENSLKYYLFSVKELKFMNEELLFDDESLITNDFPIHSSFSILPKTFFEKKGNKELKNNDYINELKKNIKFEKLAKELESKLFKYFLPKNPKITPAKNEFLICGHFNEMFDTNYCFCIWLDNVNSSLIYVDKNKNVFEINIDKFKKDSKFKYTLLCSKYKIKYNHKK